ncbi:hypothetical protein PROFUN_05509 [Planoprotostelium fungivorum]|uniref:Uncharacterized protein n=1 Tax=Planoprotostelium fungivorum TaxID=1890364 RepID=A0A2P6NR62_9EUKA|nr:hypothetical protein PROFUN_05509 [Planoprotostelium fungivorum]
MEDPIEPQTILGKELQEVVKQRRLSMTENTQKVEEPSITKAVSVKDSHIPIKPVDGSNGHHDNANTSQAEQERLLDRKKEIEELVQEKVRNAALEHAMHANNARIVELADEVKTWKSQVETLEKETAKYRDLRDNMNEAFISKHKMEEQLKEKEEQIKRLEEELFEERLSSQRESEGELMQTQKLLSLREAELTVAKASLDQVKKVMADITAQTSTNIREMDQKISAARRDADEARKQKKDMERSLKKQRMEERTQEQFDELKRQLDETRSSLQEANRRNKTLDNKIVQLKKDLASKDQSVESMRKQIDETKQNEFKIKITESNAANNLKEINNLRREVSELQAQKLDAEKEAEKRLTALKNKMEKDNAAALRRAARQGHSWSVRVLSILVALLTLFIYTQSRGLGK